MQNRDSLEKKIFSWEEALVQRNKWQKEGLEVVFTNGCFDILHYGHIDYLSKAADLGHKLIVAVNSDSSVKKLKGEKRPLNPENARMALLSALFFIDAVVLFSDETPYELISLLHPDILVKGGDYSEEQIAGADIVRQNGGKVVILPLVEGYSTTSLIEKSKQ